MYTSKNYKYYIICFVFILILRLYIIENNKISEKINNIIDNKSSNYLEITPLNELFNSMISKNTILIFEPNTYHHECIPGYTKYFIDLGYNVDILTHKSGIDSLNLFQEFENIKLFIFNGQKEMDKISQNFSSIIKKYDYILLQSTDIKKKTLNFQIDLLKVNNSIFVFHEIRWAGKTFSSYFDKNRIWTLGNLSKGLQVNPHYFGNITIKNKNRRTRFFLTSSAHRNYSYLIESLKRLKKERFNFEIIIIGRGKRLDPKDIPQNLLDNFIFKQRVSYAELYKYIQKSDYIVIPLDPDSKNDIQYRISKVTGSIQLVYGFLKPAIINEKFADFYNLNTNNSLLYNNFNLYNILRKAILLNNKAYKNLQNDLCVVEKEIYKISFNNVKKTIIEL